MTLEQQRDDLVRRHCPELDPAAVTCEGEHLDELIDALLAITEDHQRNQPAI